MTLHNDIHSKDNIIWVGLLLSIITSPLHIALFIIMIAKNINLMRLHGSYFVNLAQYIYIYMQSASPIYKRHGTGSFLDT